MTRALLLLLALLIALCPAAQAGSDHLFLGTRGENNSDCAAKNRNPQGEVHHWAKLNEAQAAEIRSRSRSGEDPRGLAAEFGVSRSTVKDIENGRSWRHQEGL